MWSRLKNSLLSRAVRRASQEEADIFRLFSLTGDYAGIHPIPNVPASSPEFGAYFERLYAEPHQKQVEFVAEQTLEQVYSLFDVVREIWPVYKRNPVDKRMYQMAAPAATAQMLALLSASPKSASVVSDELESSLDSIKRELGFVLRKKPSSIDHPDAGLGCFLDGSAKRGQVVGFYPGVVYLIGDVRHMKGYPNIDNENANLLARYDRAIIDAKDGGGIDNGDILEHTNPLALCHYINHPPQGAMPSVMPYYFNFPMDFPAEFYPYIPNVYHRCPPIWARQMDGNNILMRSAVFVALRDLEDEELFFNYRYNPKLKAPAWYHPVEGEEAAVRWRK